MTEARSTQSHFPLASGGSSFGRGENFGLVGMTILVLRHRRWILGIAVLAVAVEAAIVISRAPSYTAVSSFMAESRRAPSSLSGIAAQLGIAAPASDGPQSPAFYADLVQSRRILESLASIRLKSIDGGRPVSLRLADVLVPAEQAGRAKEEMAVRRLRQMVSAEVVQRTGVVIVSVSTSSPDLALIINQSVLDAINDFNLVNRQSQASAERRFTEKRLAEVGSDLRAAEDRLQQFLQRNVSDFSRSPSLNFDHQRLERDVALEAQVFTALTQSFEQAKIEEVRDTPVISVIEPPVKPAVANARGLLRKSFLAFVVAVILAVFVFLIFDLFLASSDAREDVSAELARLQREALADLRSPLRRFGKRQKNVAQN